MIVSGLSHSKVVDILRRAEGSVQLTICRDILPLTYSESPTPPNMAAQTEVVLAEQPAPASSPDARPSPDTLLKKPAECPPGRTSSQPLINVILDESISDLNLKKCGTLVVFQHFY